MKKLVSAVLAVTVVCSAALFSGCGGSQVLDASSVQSEASGTGTASASSAAEISGNLTLNGSTSMAEVCQALGEAFTKKYPNVKVDKSGNGSGDAPKAVEAGTARIGDLSRTLKDEEKPADFDVKTVAIDGIAIAVSKDSKVKALTSEQVTKIFTGEIKNWKEVGGSDAAINVIGRESASGTRDGFESIFKCKEKCKYASELTSTGAVKAKVASDKNAVGYISLGNVDDSVTAVKIDNVDATEENIINGTYKAHRPFIEICKKGSEDDMVNAWFQFIYSAEGQKVIRDCKLIPTDESGKGLSK